MLGMERDDYVRLGAKFDKSTAELVKTFCNARGENYSGLIRRAVKRELAQHSYLSKDEKKALGVDTDE